MASPDRCPRFGAAAGSDGTLMDTPLLFLDIDGVFTSHEYAQQFDTPRYPLDLSAHELKKFDPICVALVRTLTRSLKARIVITSTWRKTYGWHVLGAAFDLDAIAATPVLQALRGEEIQAWRRQHVHIGPYVIVDDDDMHFLPEQMPHVVHVNSNVGFTQEDAAKALHILKEFPR